MKNIKVIIQPWNFAGERNTKPVLADDHEYGPGNLPDYLASYPLHLKEGYIFDGCGNSITVNQDSFMQNGVETYERGVNKYGGGQSGIFRVYGGDSTEVINKVIAGDWVGYTAYDPTTALRNEIKNLGIHGTACGRSHASSILLQPPWLPSAQGRGYVQLDFNDRLGSSPYTATTNIPWGSSGSHYYNYTGHYLDNGYIKTFRERHMFTSNLLIKNIFFTRTRVTCVGHDSTTSSATSTLGDTEAVPYIVPCFYPGPMGYLSVENIYVKLDY